MVERGKGKMALAVSEAKRDFSRIVRESSEQLRVFTVQNAQRHGAASSLVIGGTAMELVLSHFTFTPQWEEDADSGLWTVYLPEIDVWGQGETRLQAAEDLIDAALDFMRVFLDDIPFQIKIGRGHYLPYLLRLYQAGDDRQAIRGILGVQE